MGVGFDGPEFESTDSVPTWRISCDPCHDGLFGGFAPVRTCGSICKSCRMAARVAGRCWLLALFVSWLVAVAQLPRQRPEQHGHSGCWCRLILPRDTPVLAGLARRPSCKDCGDVCNPCGILASPCNAGVKISSGFLGGLDQMRYFQYLLSVFANVTSEWPASRRIDVGGNVGRAAAAWKMPPSAAM